MSLHRACIPPKVRKDDLETVFRRYGHCSVDLRPGFGFVDYESHADAEFALRSLSGRKICGHSIVLSWSNRRPNIQRKFGAAKLSDDDGGKRVFAERRIDRRRFHHNNLGYAHYNLRDKWLEECDRVDFRQAEHGRWGEGFDSLHKNNDLDQSTGLDRYEPGYGDERGEKYYSRCLAASPTAEKSPAKNQRTLHENIRAHQTCYSCGAAGRKMCECPKKDGSRRRSSYHAARRPDNKNKSRVGGNAVVVTNSSSAGKFRHSSNRTSRSARRREADKNPFHVQKAGIDGANSQALNVSMLKCRTDHHNTKRPREREDDNLKTRNHKKSRILTTSQTSDPKSPELGKHTGSINPLPGTSLRHRSLSPIPHSLSASSVSKSRSNCSRSRSIKFRSKSKSRSRSALSSPSITLRWSLSFSSDNAELSVNGSADGILSPRAKEVTPETGHEFKLEVLEEFLPVVNRADAIVGASSEVEDLLERQRLEPDPKDENLGFTNDWEASLGCSLEEGEVPLSEDVVLEKRQLRGPTCDVESENADGPEDLKSIYLCHDDNFQVQSVSCEVQAPNPSLLEQDDGNISVGEIGAKTLQVMKELGNANSVGLLTDVEPPNQLDFRASSKTQNDKHLTISIEEFCRVLNHFGLKTTKENEQDVSAEDYFGAARLWPWEMVFYRRLKKGAISMENYAKRVAQNKEFGITDKYIRSSTGWGEVAEERS